MSVAKIIWAVSALAAIIFAFVSGFELEGALLAVLGLACGWFLDHDHRRGVIIAAIFLAMSGSGGGASSLGSIPAIGGYLTAILSSLGAVFAAASVMAIIRTLVERILKSNSASSTS